MNINTILRWIGLIMTIPAFIPVTYLLIQTINEFRNGYDKIITLSLFITYLGMFVLTTVATIGYVLLLFFNKEPHILFNLKNILVAILILLNCWAYISAYKR